MKASSPAHVIEQSLRALERLLDEERSGWAEDAGLVRLARTISEGFTGERPTTTPAATADVAHAYLAYFAPRTIAAVAAALESSLVPERFVDVGAGTGAAALAFAAAGAREVLLVDRDPRALERARALLERLPEPPRVKTLALDVESPSALPLQDVAVVSAFTLGEVRPDASADELFDVLLTLAASAPRFFLVDAGDRRRARRLQELREVALARGFHVRGPCPHEDACPALERKKDWCHLRAPRRLTPRLESFAAAVGRDPLALSYSSLDLVRDVVAREERRLLVIGEPRKEKGRARLPVCGAGGLRFLQVKKRDREAHDLLLSKERGAVLHDDGFERRGDTGHVEDAAPLRDEPEDAKLPP